MATGLRRDVESLEGALGDLVESREGGWDPSRFAEWDDDPVGFVREVLRAEPWRAQVEIAESVRDHPFTVVRSCNSAGKDWVAAALALWWVYARRGLALVTGPTQRQVRQIVMSEVREHWHRASVLPGELRVSGLRVSDVERAGILAFTSSSASKMTGYHYGRVLGILTEAQDVDAFAYEALQSNAVGAHDRLLAVGNPLAPSGRFFRACRSEAWHEVAISALEHPNVVEGEVVIPGGPTREWIDRQRKEWGEDSGLWKSRVLGEFSSAEADVLVSRPWLDRAVELHERVRSYRGSGLAGDLPDAVRPEGPLRIGLDVARHGGDHSVLCLRRGGFVREVVTFRAFADTMQTVGRVGRALRERGLSRDGGGYGVWVDEIGVGGGVVDRLRELGWNARGVNVSAPPPREDDRFLNLRAYLYWTVRRRLEAGELALPPDERLFEELLASTWHPTSAGKVQLDPKDAIRANLGRSPDLADALVLTFASGGSSVGGTAGVTL